MTNLATLRAFLAALLRVATKLTAGVWWLSTRVIGRWEWQPPSWLVWIGSRLAQAGRYVAADAKRAGLMLVVAGGMIGGWVWYLSRPVPHYVTFTVTAPGLTEYGDKGISSIKPLALKFSESAAPLQQVEKTVTAGIDLSPKMPGAWRWVSDKDLEFAPKNDWPIDKAFTVSFARKGFFARGVLLEDFSFDFRSQPFTSKITESQFYQDPRDPNLKKLVATLQFSHPVDTGQLEQRVSLAVAKDAGYLGLKADSRSYTVVYDKFKLAAYIHSAALAMPRDDTPITLRVDKGVRAARGGNETKDRLEAVVIIPGRSSLRFSRLQMTLVDNARYEPEQILLMTSSSPVPEKALAGRVSAYLLPVRHPNNGRKTRIRIAGTMRARSARKSSRCPRPCRLATSRRSRAGTPRTGSSFAHPWAATFTWWCPMAWKGSAGTFRANLSSERFRWNRTARLWLFWGRAPFCRYRETRRWGSWCAMWTTWRLRSAACCPTSCSTSHPRWEISAALM
ncbi:MAG TPA: Ig-like domain-containing protein [Candidatus Acidoferrales bacterium]|nr:Ig-like domain-containing protein [Candidatus Acidoferrales bacterium]